MNDQDPPRIEFPCDYPVKVMGAAADDFEAFVVAVMERHAGPVPAERVSVRASGKGNWLSVTVTIVATGEAQLRAIFEELKASGRVQMVL